MIRLSRLADYSVVLLAQMAVGEGDWFTAHTLSAHSGIPEPTVGKVLKALVRSGILVSLRGTNGGYSLSRTSENISIAAIVEAVDGRIALTDCLRENARSACDLSSHCTTKQGWQKINHALYSALSAVSLAEVSDITHVPQSRASASLTRRRA